MSRRNVETYANDQQALCRQNDFIPDSLFREYGVNRGLRDVNGVGVLTGLTNISKIVSFQNVDGKRVPCEGQLFYRGYNIKNLIGSLGPNEFGFEKIAYLLLFGDLPTPQQLEEFTGILSDCRTLPTNFTRDVIMKAPSKDIMNSMTRSVLTLASYDDQINGDLGNSIRQCIRLISEFPMLAVYGYHAYNHYENDDSMYIHRPDPNLSTAENILRMLRHDKSYTQLEAKALDIALLLHMEHGGGNNSTFTTRVVTSSGSDTYSTMAAALCSLKGPRHGGANIKVIEMIQDIKSHLHDWTDPEETSAYLRKLLNKEAFDHSGLIYGMGHAVYSISDPREQILRSFVNQLAVEKGRQDDLALYRNIEEEAPKLISKNRPIYKGVSANIDLYSGFLYDLLGIPVELYTPPLRHRPDRGLERPPHRGAGVHEQDHPPCLHERHAGAGVSPLPPHRARCPAFPGQTYKKQEESVALLLGILPLVADQRGGSFFSAGLDRRPAAPEVGPGAKSPVVRTLRVVGAVSKPRGAAPRGPADSGGGARLSLKKVGGKNTREEEVLPPWTHLF